MRIARFGVEKNLEYFWHCRVYRLVGILTYNKIVRKPRVES
jgi:hypothetical protein